MPQSPLFVCTDSDSDDLSSDGFDDDNSSVSSSDFDISPSEPPSRSPSPSQTRRPSFPQRQNTDIEISDGTETVNFRIELKSKEQYSDDPFAINYRKSMGEWGEKERERFRKEWWFVEDLVEKFESVEHSEFTRPFDQFRVILQQRGLHAKYEEIFGSAPDPATRSCLIMNMLLELAPDLIVRYAALEKLAKERVESMERGEKASWEIAWEKRRQAELRGWYSPRSR